MSPQTRPTPPHLTSAMAENILAAACESETRKAAKRMRLEIYQTSQVPHSQQEGCKMGQEGRAGGLGVSWRSVFKSLPGRLQGGELGRGSPAWSRPCVVPRGLAAASFCFPVQDEPIALDKQHSRDSTAITHSSYSLPASSYSQDPVYINGSLNYSYRGYGSLGGSLQPPAPLQTGNHSNGEWPPVPPAPSPAPAEPLQNSPLPRQGSAPRFSSPR